MGFSATAKLLRLTKPPTFLTLQFFFIVRPICILMGGDCRLDFRQQFPPIKTQIGNLVIFRCDRKVGRFATRSNLTVTENPAGYPNATKSDTPKWTVNPCGHCNCNCYSFYETYGSILQRKTSLSSSFHPFLFSPFLFPLFDHGPLPPPPPDPYLPPGTFLISRTLKSIYYSRVMSNLLF